MNWSTLKVLFFVVSIAVFTNCEKQYIQSNRVTEPVTIDGKSLEWQQYLVKLQDTSISAGVLNDADFIYLCVVSSNKDFNMLAGGPGLKLSFKHHDLKGKMGIRFSSGMEKMNRSHKEMSFNRDDTSQQRREPVINGPQTIELFGPGDDSTVISPSVAQRYGIKAKIARMKEQMIYEIMLPIHDNDSSVFSLGITKDTLMSVTVETIAMKTPERGSGGMGGGPGGGMGGGPGGGMGGGPGGGMGDGPGGGMGGGPGGGMGGGPGGRMGGGPGGGNGPENADGGMQMPNPVKMNFIVKLAVQK